MRKKLAVLVFLLLTVATSAQDHTQTIRGQVFDNVTQSTLPGANIVVVGSDPLIGTTTDNEGYFTLEEVPAGRITLKVSFIGYNTKYLENIYISATREKILEIALEEKAISMETVEIKGRKSKKQPVNELTSTSARAFTEEETERFAGSRNDVARMASNYAGVGSPNDAENGIVIRGNSPNGLLWMLEGVEIPNPNHFGSLGASGGPVSMLNNNVLSRSDFITGAFPSEYGNAFSGVFDLHMRHGNYQQHEFTGQMGFNGFEFGAEGPLDRENKASYVVNYRYSMLSIMSELGMDFGTGTAIPYYQDANFNINYPTEKSGTFTLFGVWGRNHIEFINSESAGDDDGFYGDGSFDTYNKNSMATIGAKHNMSFSKKTSLETIINYSSAWQNNTLDSVSRQGNIFEDFIKQNLNNHYETFKSTLTHKAGRKHLFRIGGSLKLMNYDLTNRIWQTHEENYRDALDSDGSTSRYQSFVHWKWKPTNELTFNTGLHYTALELTAQNSLEPRFGIHWKAHPGHTLSLAYGQHSKILPLQYYMQRSEIAPDIYIRTNDLLDFSKAHHYVAGYDWSIMPKLRLKLEAYYQDLYDVPVESSPSSYSALNLSSMTFTMPDSLQNNGTGTNYGLEMTLEQFMKNGSYFLLTASLFESKYVASDEKERSTAFDNDYVVNLLAGKEWQLSGEDAQKMMWLVVDAKVTAAGGKRYTPVDVQESIEEQTTVYKSEQAFSEQYGDYFRADIRAAFRMENSRVSQEWAVDIQNVTGHTNPFYQTFNLTDNQIETVNQLGFMPVMQYRIYF